MSGEMVPALAEVVRHRRETHDTFSLELEVPEPMARFRPGQFNMLYAFGVGEAPISISGAGKLPARLWHTIREVGPVTRALGALRRGAGVGVRGPFGSPWPLDRVAGRDVVFIAGGIGLAPLRPAIVEMVARRPRQERVAVVYGARTPRDLLYARDLARWGKRLGGNVAVTVDRSDDSWQGHTGVVTKLLSRVDFEPSRAVAMSCGPEVMMRFATRELARLGVAESEIFVSLERSMKCAVGTCGHCMLAGTFVCKDGPVFALPRVAPLLSVAEL